MEARRSRMARGRWWWTAAVLVAAVPAGGGRREAERTRGRERDVAGEERGGSATEREGEGE